ncbi:BMP family ABC transporter substrate-binding protein, partial [Bacillus subtilis]|uniref:BMP family ABC transporter substrate-binding protein n=1 Tax=Bacillus subtilis TaxID=1423 RepID=UPI002DBFC2AB
YSKKMDVNYLYSNVFVFLLMSKNKKAENSVKIYATLVIAEQFNKGTLEGGDHYYDLNTGVVEMGTFSPLVDKDFQQRIAKLIKTYNKTGELPKNE